MAIDYGHAVYAGSFDPITLGHEAVIGRACRLFSRVTVAVGANPSKSSFFSPDERVQQIRAATKKIKNVEVVQFEGLLIHHMKKTGAGVIVRGLRLLTDFEYEFQLGLANRDLSPDIETVFVLTESEHVYMSSSLVKEIAQNGGDYSRYVSKGVHAAMGAKLGLTKKQVGSTAKRPAKRKRK